MIIVVAMGTVVNHFSLIVIAYMKVSLRRITFFSINIEHDT